MSSHPSKHARITARCAWCWFLPPHCSPPPQRVRVEQLLSSVFALPGPDGAAETAALVHELRETLLALLDVPPPLSTAARATQ
jgi:hypothetical protein